MTECRPAGRNFLEAPPNRSACTFHCLPRSGAWRVAASLLPSALRTVSHLKNQILRRRAPRASVLAGRSTVHFPLSVITAGPLLPSPYCWPGHSERLPAGPLHPFPPCRPGLSSPLLPLHLYYRSCSSGRKREECPSRQGALSPWFNLVAAPSLPPLPQ